MVATLLQLHLNNIDTICVECGRRLKVENEKIVIKNTTVFQEVNTGIHILSNPGPPGGFLHLSHHGDICVVHQEFLHGGGELVHHVLGLRAVAAAFVATFSNTEVQQRLPALILAQNVRVPDHDQKGLGSEISSYKMIINMKTSPPGDGHVEPLRVLEEAELVLLVSVDVLRGAPHSGHDDHPSLLTLELLSASHHHLTQTISSQLLPQFLHLTSVGSNHANLLWFNLTL